MLPCDDLCRQVVLNCNVRHRMVVYTCVGVCVSVMAHKQNCSHVEIRTLNSGNACCRSLQFFFFFFLLECSRKEYRIWA